MLINFISFTYAQRADLVNEIYVPANFQIPIGEWRTSSYNCSSGWATGFQVFYEKIYFGIIVLKLFCSDWKGFPVTTIDYYDSIPVDPLHFYGD